MTSATTVEEYLAGLEPERRMVMEQVRTHVLQHIPKGYQEVLQYGMISYVIPLEYFPNTYNKQALTYLSLAAQKRHYALYLMCVYGPEESEFKQRYESAGKKCDMGKSCLRFQAVDDLNLPLIGEFIERYTPDEFIARYKQLRGEA